MKQSPKSRFAGFTLLEMMIAFIILSIAITSIYGALTNTLRRSNERFNQYEASEFAVSLIAEFKVTGTDNLSELDGIYQGKWRWQVRIEQVYPSDHPAVQGIPFTQISADIFSASKNILLASHQLLITSVASP